jgi:hypothetical protein
MKRCPTCQRTYTDDSLTFCLQDGSLLLSDSPSYDQGARTEVLPQPVAPTIASPRPDSTTVEQRRVTNPTWEEMGPRSTAPAAQPPARNRALTVGVFVIAILLLGLVGIGLVLLMRGSSESSRETATVENRDSGANVNHNGQGNTNSNVNSNASNQANANASPTPRATSTPPAANNNGSQPPPADAAARAEAKILANSPLTESDLAGLSPTVLRRLRNAIYARHGRTFNTPEIQSYFNSRPWYRPRSDYSDSDLTATDRANVQLIQAAEGG